MLAIPKNVMFEAFDDEGILLSFDTGAYYSLTSQALNVWQVIDACPEQTVSPDWLVEQPCANDLSPQDVRQLLQSFVNEGLLTGDEKPLGDANEFDFIQSFSGTVFEHCIEKHTDAEKLLLIDPIHDVDSAGWPNKPE